MRYTLVLLVIISSTIYCQPEWVTKIPPGYSNDYFVGKGLSGDSKIDAAKNAFEDAIISIMRNNTIEVIYSQEDKIISTQTGRGEDVNLDVVRKSAQELQISGESKTIRDLKEVETYFETQNGLYVAWVLVSMPKEDPISPPSSFSPVWRSVLLPGWGQFYKDESFKGVSFMTITIGSLAGGFILKELSNDASRNAVASRTQSRRDFYNDEAKRFNTLSTISFIASAVVYSWNVVDAIIVKQDNLYVNIESNGLNNKIFICVRL